MFPWVPVAQFPNAAVPWLHQVAEDATSAGSAPVVSYYSYFNDWRQSVPGSCRQTTLGQRSRQRIL